MLQIFHDKYEKLLLFLINALGFYHFMVDASHKMINKL